MPLFSSDEFAWKDLNVIIAGRKVTGIQGIKIKTATEKEFIFGAGNLPRAIATGNKTTEGEVTLLQSEIDLLDQAAQVALEDPTADLTDLPGVEIVMSYGSGNSLRTDILLGVQFGEYEKGMGQNDKFMAVTVPFMALAKKTNA
jgi:hypothetical protein